MRVLCIDQDRVGLDFCLRCVAHGHEVRWFRYSKHPVKDGQGFPGIEIVTDYRASIPWAKDGLIITTGNGKYIYDLDKWREFGYRNILAPSVRSAALEINRGDGMRLFQQKGLNVAPYTEFDTLEAAQRHVLKTDQNYAFKTLGSEDDKSLTFVSSTPAQLAEWLDAKIKSGMKLKGPCMLQEKVEMVAEVGIAGWMGPDGFVPDKWEISYENKRLESGNFGPNTGEVGTVVQYVHADPLVDILESFEEELRGRGHLGDVNINGGVTADGSYFPFEWTTRLGWPDFYARTSMHKGDFAKQLQSLLKGEDDMRVSYAPHVVVVVAQRPYPYGEGCDEEVLGKPIYGVEEEWDAFHPVQVMLSKGYTMIGESITTGAIYRTTGCYVACVTASGKDVAAARKNVYASIDNIKLSDMLVRDDVGEALETGLPALHRLGYSTEIEY